MKRLLASFGFCALLAVCAGSVPAQTADELIDKHLAAIGGRDTISKLQSRMETGTMTLSMQGAEVAGTIEVYNKVPNKTRVLIKLDLSAMGAAEMTIDQRCDGETGFQINTLQGDKEITGNQLQNMRNAQFPSPLLNYKETGAKVEVVGKEKIDGRDMIVLQYTPKTGSASRQYFDPETFLITRIVMKMDIPELGGEIEQTTDLSDYRDTDGIKLPFKSKITNPMQLMTITLSKIEHNKPIDDAMFSKPATAPK